MFPNPRTADEVSPVRVAEGGVGLVGDDQAGIGDTWGVGETQVALGSCRFGRPDLHFPGPWLLVVLECLGELRLRWHVMTLSPEYVPTAGKIGRWEES